MRVLIVTEVYRPGLGGVQEAIDTLVNGLIQCGDDVVVITGSQRGLVKPYVEELENGARIYRLPAIPSPVNRSNNRISVAMFSIVKACWKDEGPFDIVHMHTPASWLHHMVARLARRQSIPYIVTNHVMAQNLTMNKTGLVGRVAMNAYEKQARMLLKHAACMSAPTRAALDAMSVPSLPKVAISNGLDTDYYSPGSIDRNVVRKFKVDMSSKRIMYTGRLDGEKRIDMLIDAMPGVLKKHPDTQLLIVGKGMLADNLKAQAASLDLSDRVVFCGYVTNEEKRSLLRMGDLFAIASPAELQCIAALEALACKLPLVVADQVALPELIDNGNNGIAFAYPNVDDLVAKLCTMIEDEVSRHAMATHARAWVCAHHDSKKTVQMYRDIYNDYGNKTV